MKKIAVIILGASMLFTSCKKENIRGCECVEFVESIVPCCVGNATGVVKATWRNRCDGSTYTETGSEWDFFRGQERCAD